MQDIFHRIRCTVTTRADRRLIRVHNEWFFACVILTTIGKVFLDLTAVLSAINPSVVQPKLKLRSLIVFFDPPDKEVDLYISSAVRDMVKVWRGDLSLRKALREKLVRTQGNTHLIRSMPDWLGICLYADIKPAQK